MELVLINDNKLKIVLTHEDMSTMDITAEEINYDDTGTRRIFWELLDKAKHQTGFDAARDKIFVQVYPDTSGGCLMYVTKLNDTKTESKTTTYEKKYKTKLYTGTKKKRLVFAFENSETLFELCRNLHLMGYSGKSDIYCDDIKYYLYIEDNKEQALEIISEYGLHINSVYFSYYLFEYCKKIVSDDAVNIFCGIYLV